MSSGIGWGGPAHDQREKNVCVSPRIAYNAAAGVEAGQVSRLAWLRWGFSHLGRQTESKKIPNPRKMFFRANRPMSPLHRPVRSLWSCTHLPLSKFPEIVSSLGFVFLDAPVAAPIARKCCGAVLNF